MTKVLIETEGTEFEQHGKPYAVIDEDFREGKPIMLDEEDIEAITANSSDEEDDSEESNSEEDNSEENEEESQG